MNIIWFGLIDKLIKTIIVTSEPFSSHSENKISRYTILAQSSTIASWILTHGKIVCDIRTTRYTPAKLSLPHECRINYTWHL